jgi:hypothetical protein
MSPAYKVWLVCGMGTIVAVMVALGLNDPGNQDLVFVALLLVGIYLAGIFFFQFRGLNRIQTDAGAPAPAAPDETVSSGNPPAEWQALMRELAVKPLDPEAQRAATAGTTGAVRSQIKYGAVLCAAIIAGMALFYAGVGGVLRPFGEGGPGFPVALIPVFVLIAYGVVRIPFTLAAAQASSDAYLGPLGLAVTQMPHVGVTPRYGYGGSGMQTDVSGPTIMSGERHGRRVEIRLDAKHSQTTVGGSAPAFKIEGDDGRLKASGRTPAALRGLVEAIGSDPRWKRVEATGTADGVVVSRRLRASQATEQRWMADLWLAERLADAAGR